MPQPLASRSPDAVRLGQPEIRKIEMSVHPPQPLSPCRFAIPGDGLEGILRGRMVEVIMPKMGDGMEEGTLLEWLKKDGDTVKSGEPIATIQTDKATLEMEAPGSGTLAGILVAAGATVPVAAPLAAVLKSGESLPAGWGSGSSTPAPKAEAVVEPETTATVAATPAVESSAHINGERVKASPLAKKIAEELGVNLASLSGSGPGGRIVEKDVRSAVGSAGTLTETPEPAKTAVPALTPSGEDRLVPLNKLRQITAQRTAQSKQTAPHFYVTVEVEVDRILALRAMFEKDGAEKPSLNDFVIRACALALRAMPVVNSTYQGDKLLEFGAVHIGMAVALEDGLTVPVLHHADQLSLGQISARSKELAAKARENRLSLEELTGGTFSISNMGMLDVENFGAIINPPNAAIVAVASARKTPVVDEASGEIVVQTRMKMTGSFDHRVVDGAVGARFMNELRGLLEAPTRLL